MDYSLLLGVHNMDQAERERQMEGSQGDSDQKRPMAQQKALYSTAMESIQGGAARGESIDTDDTYVSPPWGSASHHPPPLAAAESYRPLGAFEPALTLQRLDFNTFKKNSVLLLLLCFIKSNTSTINSVAL